MKACVLFFFLGLVHLQAPSVLATESQGITWPNVISRLAYQNLRDGARGMPSLFLNDEDLGNIEGNHGLRHYFCRNKRQGFKFGGLGNSPVVYQSTLYWKLPYVLLISQSVLAQHIPEGFDGVKSFLLSPQFSSYSYSEPTKLAKLWKHRTGFQSHSIVRQRSVKSVEGAPPPFLKTKSTSASRLPRFRSLSSFSTRGNRLFPTKEAAIVIPDKAIANFMQYYLEDPARDLKNARELVSVDVDGELMKDHEFLLLRCARELIDKKKETKQYVCFSAQAVQVQDKRANNRCYDPALVTAALKHGDENAIAPPVAPSDAIDPLGPQVDLEDPPADLVKHLAPAQPLAETDDDSNPPPVDLSDGNGGDGVEIPLKEEPEPEVVDLPKPEGVDTFPKDPRPVSPHASADDLLNEEFQVESELGSNYTPPPVEPALDNVLPPFVPLSGQFEGEDHSEPVVDSPATKAKPLDEKAPPTPVLPRDVIIQPEPEPEIVSTRDIFKPDKAVVDPAPAISSSALYPKLRVRHGRAWHDAALKPRRQGEVWTDRERSICASTEECQSDAVGEALL